jgi:hypothetical protein
MKQMVANFNALQMRGLQALIRPDDPVHSALQGQVQLDLERWGGAPAPSVAGVVGVVVERATLACTHAAFVREAQGMHGARNRGA